MLLADAKILHLLNMFHTRDCLFFAITATAANNRGWNNSWCVAMTDLR